MIKRKKIIIWSDAKARPPLKGYNMVTERKWLREKEIFI